MRQDKSDLYCKKIGGEAPSCYGNREMQTVEIVMIPSLTSRFVRDRISGEDYYSLFGGFRKFLNRQSHRQTHRGLVIFNLTSCQGMLNLVYATFNLTSCQGMQILMIPAIFNNTYCDDTQILKKDEGFSDF